MALCRSAANLENSSNSSDLIGARNPSRVEYLPALRIFSRSIVFPDRPPIEPYLPRAKSLEPQ